MQPEQVGLSRENCSGSRPGKSLTRSTQRDCGASWPIGAST